MGSGTPIAQMRRLRSDQGKNLTRALLPTSGDQADLLEINLTGSYAESL